MFLRTVEMAFARFQARRDSRALAIVFDRTAPELLRVARHLASTEASAEDLVQATFVQAIESADAHERGRPVLPWLLGILGNQARAARRRSKRAIDPTRTRGDVVADASADAIAHELGVELQRAIDRLPEAYRPALRLWFEHGLEAQEIARTLERPAGTVRAQISRGIDQLRRLLPAGLASAAAVSALPGRGLAAVRAAVLQATPGTSMGLGSALVFGGLLMLHHKVLAAGAALVLGLVGWSWWSGGEPDASTVVAAAGDGGGAAAVADVGDAAPARSPAPAPAAARDRVEVEPAPVPPADERPPEAATGTLAVRLVASGSRAPLAGYGVAAQPGTALQAFGAGGEFVATDADGRVRFEGCAPGAWHVDVDRFGRVAARDVSAGAVVECEVELPAGVTVTGTVVDARQQPVPGATVVLQGSRLSAPPVAVTDALGRFRAPGLAAGVELQARAAGRVPSPAHRVAGADGGAATMTLQLGDTGRRLSGRAVDADGQPLAGAAISVLPEAHKDLTFWERDKPRVAPLWLCADDDGRFVTDEAPAARLLVLAQPRSMAAMPCWTTVDTTNGSATADLRAAAGGSIRGRVEGVAPAGVQVMGWPRGGQELGFLTNLVAARLVPLGADGEFALEGLLPGEVEVRVARGAEILASDVVTVDAGAVVRWDATVAAARPLRVRVEADGDLPPGLTIWVGPHVPDNSAPSILPVNGGEARFEGRRSGDVDVTAVVMVGGQQLMMLARLEAVPVSTDEVVLALRADQLPAHSLRGRFVDDQGAPRGGVEIAALGFGGAVGGQPLMVRREATTAADGTFAIGPLPAGSYQLTIGGMTQPRAIGVGVLTAAQDLDLGDLKELR
ncbi:MAG: sigma-70 family RNA polymerase sigma factor [Planctomycetota bacterium]